MTQAWLSLVAANVAVFLAASLRDTRPIVDSLGLNAADVLSGGRVWQLVTYAFVHADGYHLLFNMLGLFFFGRFVEEGIGSRRFVGLYLLCVVTGGAAQVAADAASGRAWSVTIGASGGVNGILALAALCVPRLPVYVWGIFPAPLWALCVFYLLLDAGGMGGSRDGIAHAAHLGGAAGGVLFWAAFIRVFGAGFLPRVLSPRLRAVRPDYSAIVVHLCAVCGRSERDGRALEFRVCGACGKEYCQEHLAGHACGGGETA